MFFLMNNRKLVIFLTIIASIAIGFFCTNLKIDSSINAVLPSNDADIIFNNNISKEFGNNEEIYVILTSKSTFYTAKNLNTILKITNFFKDNSDAIQTTGISSLTTILEQYDKSEISKFTNEDIELAKNRIEKNPLAKNQIINSTENITLVRAPIKIGFSSNDKNLSAFIQEMRTKVVEYTKDTDLTAEFTGAPVINSDISKYMIMDLYYLFPIAILIVMFTIVIMLKSFKGALIPLIITLLSILWTFGIKGLLKSPLTLTEAVIPIVLISIACADGIHVTQQSLYFINKGVPSYAAALDAMKFVRTAVILSAITTAQGFGSLILSPGVSMKNMGIFLAIGVLLAMGFTLYLAPVMISFFGEGKTHKYIGRFEEKSLSSKGQNSKVRKVGNFLLNFKWLILIFTLIIIGLCIPGIINTKTDLDEVRYFKPSTPVRVATEKIEKDMGGITTLYLVFENSSGKKILDTNFVKKLDGIQDEISKFKEVSFTTSYINFIKYLNYVLKKQADDSFALPENKILIQRLISTLKNTSNIPQEELTKYLTTDDKKANMHIRLYNSNTTEIEAVEKQLAPILKKEGIYKFDEKNIPENSTVYRLAGDYIKIKNSSIIIKSQINSLIGAIISVFILLAFIYKSPLISFVVTIPVLIAVFFNFTIMWLCGISLNPATSIIASVGIGAGVDYSIHYFARFKRIYLLTNDYKKSLVDALIESHRSILFNALSVAIGFLVLLFSQYTIIRNFGWIVSLTMMTSSFGALIILPALFYIFKPKVKA